jgi:DNA ligase-1
VQLALLQQRIGRKTLDKKILEEVPVVVLAYDSAGVAGRRLAQPSAGRTACATGAGHRPR